MVCQFRRVQLRVFELERLLFSGDGFGPDEKMQLRSDLLRYCHQDTWGLVKLLDYLIRQAN
jgi:hypothetical protein